MNNPPATGQGAPVSPLATTQITPTVSVGNAAVTVLFAGLTPNLVGLGQINIQLPSTLPAGASLPLVVSFGSSASPSVNLWVAGTGGVGGNAPTISISPTSLSFGQVTVGATKSLTPTITNTGSGLLHVGQLAVTGSTDFTVNANPTTLGPSAQFPLNVIFKPLKTGAALGTLRNSQR